MRVITGSARGRRLITLDGEDVRPTTDMVKEAIFSILQFDIEGRTVLDLFAGSGQLGIEALSRGAKLCTFVDQSGKAIDVVRKNLENCSLIDRARVLKTDALVYVSGKAAPSERCDIALLDPPYRSGLLEKALPGVAERMNKGGVIVCESPADAVLPEQAGDFVKCRSYRYGKIGVTLYRHSEMVER